MHLRIAVSRTLVSLSAFMFGGAAQAQEGAKLQTANTGAGYALCGSCTVPKDISSQVTLAPKDEPGDRIIVSGTIYKEEMSLGTVHDPHSA